MNLLVFEQLTFILPVICIGNQGILQFKKANKDSSPGKVDATFPLIREFHYRKTRGKSMTLL